jgi:uncharacterized protein involved in tolerance to divalent cations
MAQWYKNIVVTRFISVVKDDESAVFFKTIEKKIEEICQVIKHNHSYEIPAIIKIAAEAETVFFQWIKEASKS